MPVVPTNECLPVALAALSASTSRSPLRLQASVPGDLDALLRTLAGRLPACGAWVSAGLLHSSGAAEIRFEVWPGAVWDLYALLVSLGLNLAPASHWELCLLCGLCRNRDPNRAGQVVDMELKLYSRASAAGFAGQIA